MKKKAIQDMKYKTHNDGIPFKSIYSQGYLQGYIEASYWELKDLFGQPMDREDNKVDVEWVINFEDGSYATIYNYKNGKNYCGKNGIPTTKIRDWHIGGVDQKAIPNIEKLLKDIRE